MENLLNIQEEISFDEFGFLEEFYLWNEEIALQIAIDCNNFVLKEEHWRIIYFLRDFFEEYKEVPTVREFCKEMKMSLYQLYELFPKGPIKGACRIAGLPKPAHCV